LQADKPQKQIRDDAQVSQATVSRRKKLLIELGELPAPESAT